MVVTWWQWCEEQCVLGGARAVNDQVADSGDDRTQRIIRRLISSSSSSSTVVIISVLYWMTLGRQVTHQAAQRVLTCVFITAVGAPCQQ